jgi:hypothetical protein
MGRKENHKMKIRIREFLVMALLAIAANAEAGTKARSKSIVIDSPADLPESAQRRSEAIQDMQRWNGFSNTDVSSIAHRNAESLYPVLAGRLAASETLP